MNEYVMGTDTRKAMVDTWGILSRHGITPSRKAHKQAVPSGLSSFWDFYGDGAALVKPHLQRHISRAIAEARFIQQKGMLAPMRVVEVADDDDNEEKRPSSSTRDWLLAPPSAATYLSTRAFHSAVRHRYHLPARPGLPVLCECGDELTPQHWHWCERTRSGVIRRHDSVKKALILQAKRAGLVVQEEPVVSIGGDRSRCDLVFGARGGSVYVDVMITCPWAPSKRDADGGIKAGEKVKLGKWRDPCAALHSQFVAFVMSSIGEMGDEARRCIALMAAEHAANAPEPNPHIASIIATAVGVALQTGNGIIDDQGCALPACHPAAYVPAHPSMIRVARADAAPAVVLLATPMEVKDDLKRSRPPSTPPASPPLIPPGLSLHSTHSYSQLLQEVRHRAALLPPSPPSSPPGPSPPPLPPSAACVRTPSL